MRIREYFGRIVTVAARIAFGVSVCCTAFGADRSTAAKDSPNILWIIVEDMSCHFGYQGQALVDTPNVDRLARGGAVFSNAYVSSPVCSPSRSALITGMYQTSIGVEHHYTGRGTIKHHLPAHVRTIPELFKEAGYYTCNTNQGFKAFGKTDYDFEYDRKALYDGPDWSGRKQGQPFFAQIQLSGGKLRNIPRAYEHVKAKMDNLITADQVTLPPYYPDDPVFREDWAQYLNSVQYTDKEVGLVLQRLEEEELLDNTVIFFITDHGISQARGKQFLYDEGAKIPFVVWGPWSHRTRDGSRGADLPYRHGGHLVVFRGDRHS